MSHFSSLLVTGIRTVRQAVLLTGFFEEPAGGFLEE